MNGSTRNFTFDEKKHVYTLDGKRLYGITNVLSTIAKPALIQWAANEAVKFIIENGTTETQKYCGTDGDISEDWIAIELTKLNEAKTAHRKKRDNAADKGKDIHAICEGLIKDAIATNSGFLKVFTHPEKQIQEFLNWANAHKVQFLSSELQMFSETMWTAGTCDFTAIIDGKKYMGDIKTYSAIHDRTPFLQCGGYMLMSEEMGEKYDGSVIVRLGKDGSFEVKYSYDTDGDKEGFKATLTLFKCLEAFKV